MTSPVNVEIWNSVDQLRANATAWDDLWQRSTATSPATRAEPLAVWFDHFSRADALRAIVVRDHAGIVAALPVMVAHRWRFIPVARLPKNAWSSAGELMVDPTRANDATIAQLVDATQRLKCLNVMLEKVNPRTLAWKAMFRRLASQQLLCRYRRAARVGCVEIAATWEAYEASRSRNHRQQMRKLLRRVCEQGKLKLRIVEPSGADEIKSQLQRGFEVEDRSWKGEAGTSVLRNEDVLTFFCRQAESLARHDHVRLVFLELDGRPIAFEYGWFAKGTYFSPKVGYDAAFAQYSPGQLLRYELLRLFHGTPGTKLVDFWGPLTPATARWTTHSYPVIDATMVPYGTAAMATRQMQNLVSSVRRATAKAGRQLAGELPGKATAPSIR